MDIAALLLWMVTVAAGVYLLAAGRPARAPAGPAPAPAAETAGAAHAPGVPRTAGVPQAAATAYAAGAAVPPITHTRITTRPGEHPLLEFMHPALGVAGLGCWIAFVITRFSVFAWAAFGVIIVTIAAGLTWYTVNARAARAAPSGREPGVSRDGTGQPGAAERGAAEPGAGADGAAEPGAGADGAAEPGAGADGAAEPGAGADGAAEPGAGADGVRAPARRYPARRLLVHGSGAAVTFVLALVTALAAHHA